MHELYSRYFLQHILWLKGSHHDYYVQPPAVRHHDIADMDLKIIKDHERCLLWLDKCLEHEEDFNMLNLRTFLCDHSMHYLPVNRFDDHRVLFETAHMLSDNRYAIVVRPKFMTSSTTVEQGAIFAHILGKKPGDVYAWGKGEFTQNAAAYAHPLTTGESAYLAHNNLAPIDPQALTDEQAREAQRLFGDGPEARTQYANWRSRARIINHYKFTHPATVEGLMLYYRVTRDTNPAWFALERGWQLGRGKEMFTGKPVRRSRAGLELLLGLGVIKLFGALAKAGCGAEAPKARPVKPAKGKGMPEVESPGKKAGDIDDGIQKKYIGNREGTKTKPTSDKKFKRKHLDGDTKDPYTLMPDGKPMGAEVGKVPSHLKGLDDLPANHDKYVKDGWPSLDIENAPGRHTRDFRNFTDAKPDNLKPGTKIYRIIDDQSTEFKNGVSGSYWTTEMPRNKTAWRKDYAVKDSWNDNGYVIEETVGPEGLKVWRGGTAAQEYKKSDFFLRGGQEQIFVQRGAIGNPQPKLTNWPDL